PPLSPTPPPSPLFPYTTLFRSSIPSKAQLVLCLALQCGQVRARLRTLRVEIKRPLKLALCFSSVSSCPKHACTRVSGNKKPKRRDRKSTRLNSSHGSLSYAVFC